MNLPIRSALGVAADVIGMATRRVAGVEKHLAGDPQGMPLKRSTDSSECDLVPRVWPEVRDHFSGHGVALVNIGLAAAKHDVDVVSFLACQMTVHAFAAVRLGLEKKGPLLHTGSKPRPQRYDG